MKKNLSYWEKDSFLRRADFTVIGSGIVGINAALKWKEKYPKSRVVVIERGSLPSGASTKNAGFACFGSLSELVEDLEQYGEQEVFALVAKRWEGLKCLRTKLGDSLIDYEENGGYELFLEDSKDAAHLKKYIPFLNDRIASTIGQQAVFSIVENTTTFGFRKNTQLIRNRVEGQLHPGKMMQAFLQLARAKGIILLTGATVQNWKEDSTGVFIETDLLELKTKKLLVATNGFTTQLLPEIELQPARNQVIVTQPIPNLSFKGCFHHDRGYYYFRNIGNRILLGGARNLAPIAETTAEFGESSIIQQGLLKFLSEVILPNQEVEIDQKWSGILGVGTTKTPIVKRISEHVGIAVRLGGMGVAIGTLIGEEGAELFGK